MKAEAMAKSRKIDTITITNTKPCRWSELPDVVLHFILMYLTASVFDLFAFSAVCKPWRVAAMSSKKDYMSSRPPMLMLHLANTPGSFEFRTISNPKHHITQDLKLAGKTYVGSSFGHLIMVDHQLRYPCVAIVNPLSGANTRIPLPRSRHTRQCQGRTIHIETAVLSAPPINDDDCMLLCWGRNCDKEMAIRPLKGDGWITQLWSYGFVFRAIGIGKKVFALTYDYGVVIMDLKTLPSEMTSVRVQRNIMLPESSMIYSGTTLSQLGGELLAICLTTKHDHMERCSVKAHRLNSEIGEWEEVDTLGSRALFMSYKECFVSENPTMWGGKENSIYFISPNKRAMMLLHMNRSRPEMVSDSLPTLQSSWMAGISDGLYNWV